MNSVPHGERIRALLLIAPRRTRLVSPHAATMRGLVRHGGWMSFRDRSIYTDRKKHHTLDWGDLSEVTLAQCRIWHDPSSLRLVWAAATGQGMEALGQPDEIISPPHLVILNPLYSSAAKPKAKVSLQK